MLKRPVGRPPKKPIVLYHTQKGETIMAKKTRNASIFIAEPKGPFLKGVLILALWISIALGVPVSGDTTVVGTGDPAVDLPAVQAAVDDGGTVTLKNGGANGDIAFNFGAGGITIRNEVAIQGGDVAGNMARIEASGDQAVFSGDKAIYIEVGGSDNVTIENCHIVGTGESCISGYDIMTTGTVRLENNVIEGQYAIWFGTYQDPTPQLVTHYEICSNTITATGFSIGVVDSKSVRIENNRIESPYGIAANVGSNNGITVKNNTVNASGGYYYYAGPLTITIGMRLAHFAGFSGGEVSGNTILVAPVSAGAPIFSTGIYYGGYDTPASGVLTTHNTISGQADYPILLVAGSSDNIFAWNDLSGMTAKKMDMYDASQIAVSAGCNRNLFTRNTIGPLGEGATAGIMCAGSSNDFVRNDYTQSGIPGLTAGTVPCVWLSNYDTETGSLIGEPQDNLVFEALFPEGTDVAEQVLDDPQESTGATTNVIVGLGQLPPRPPLAHWELNETEGDIAYDSVADNDAVVMGDALWQPEGGQIDGALQFDGIDDYLAASFILDPVKQPFSAFAWIKGGQPGQTIISQQGAFGAWLSVDPAGALSTGLTFPLPAVTSDVVITDDQWHHIALVSDGAGMSLCVDNVEVVRSSTSPIMPATGDLHIGAGNNLEPGTFWSGMIDDVRIYDRVVAP